MINFAKIKPLKFTFWAYLRVQVHWVFFEVCCFVHHWGLLWGFTLRVFGGGPLCEVMWGSNGGFSLRCLGTCFVGFRLVRISLKSTSLTATQMTSGYIKDIQGLDVHTWAKHCI